MKARHLYIYISLFTYRPQISWKGHRWSFMALWFILSARGRPLLKDFSVILFFIGVLSVTCLCLLCLILAQSAAYEPETHTGWSLSLTATCEVRWTSRWRRLNSRCRERDETEKEPEKKEDEYQTASQSTQHLACWLWLSSLTNLYKSSHRFKDEHTKILSTKIYNTLQTYNAALCANRHVLHDPHSGGFKTISITRLYNTARRLTRRIDASDTEYFWWSLLKTSLISSACILFLSLCPSCILFSSFWGEVKMKSLSSRSDETPQPSGGCMNKTWIFCGHWTSCLVSIIVSGS